MASGVDARPYGGGEFGFAHLACQFPDRRVSVEALARECGYDDVMVTRLRDGGLHSVPVAGSGELPALVRGAVARLADAVPDLSARVGAVVFAHSIPTLAPEDLPFLDLCLGNLRPLGAPRVAVSGQPCAVMHLAVRLAGALLNEIAVGQGVLLLGADSAPSACERIFFGSAMGDVAVAGLVTRDAPHDRVLASLSHSEIIAVAGELSPEADINRFRSANPFLIREIIQSCVAAAGVSLRKVALIVPHTPYTQIWDMLATLLSFPRERILTDYIGETGHLNSNDSFAHYIRAVQEGRIESGALALLVNPGFGGTRGCTLMRR